MQMVRVMYMPVDHERATLTPIATSPVRWHIRGQFDTPPVWALDARSAAAVFRRALVHEAAARASPDLVLPTRGREPGDVAAALSRLPSSGTERVVLTWNETDAIVIDWTFFCEHWWSCCYPSADESTVVPLAWDWILYWRITEEFLWKDLTTDRAE
jgi:hypothetical protein